MERSLNALWAQADAVTSSTALDAYRVHAGLADGHDLATIAEAAPSLAEPETFHRLAEAHSRATTDADQKAALQRLLECCLHRLLAQRTLALDQTIADTLGTSLPFRDGTVRLEDALLGLDDPDAGARAMLEPAVGDALQRLQPTLARRLDTAIHLAAELGFPSLRAAHEAASGRLLEPWLAQAETFLTETEAAYRDVLAYALRRADPELKPTRALRHHAVAAIEAPWMWLHYRSEDVVHAATRTFEDVGLWPSAHGHVTTDFERRPGKRTGARVAPISAPDDVRVVAEVRGGFRGFDALLGALGEAQAWSLPATSLPLPFRRFHDPASPRGLGATFAALLLDEGWLKRTLRIPSAPAREGARLAALRTLFELRRSCAQLSYSLELARRGPVQPLAEEYDDRLSRALAVPGHAARYLIDLRGFFDVVDGLRAQAFATTLRHHLLERANEDWWRNPTTGGLVKALLQEGGREGTEALAERTLGRRPTLAMVGAHLVAVLAA